MKLSFVNLEASTGLAASQVQEAIQPSSSRRRIQRRTNPGLGADADLDIPAAIAFNWKELDLEAEKPCPRIKIVKQGGPDQFQTEPLQPGSEMRDECVAVSLGRSDTDMKSSAYELLESQACESLISLLTVTRRPRRMKKAMQVQPADFHSRGSIRMVSRTRMPEGAKLLDIRLISTCCEMRWAA